MSTVVISDIHIGTNEVTNWYQTSVHEPYFLKMVNWIINKKEALELNRFLGCVDKRGRLIPHEESPTKR
jgi:hypothetical protein